MWSVGDRMNATDIVECCGVDLNRASHSREVSCREVMQPYLAQIDRINPRVNAIVSRVDLRPALVG
jgi:amidase